MQLFYLLFNLQFALAASKIYTGFNYGAFWGTEATAKKETDFLDGFNIAKNLSTDIHFDSVRLFSCLATGTVNEPTGAFDAAVESKTNLLLGFWITPERRGDSNDDLIKNEMAALDKGFQKHGQVLADLVIGLSVGNEDIYRWENTVESGIAADGVVQMINKVKEAVAFSSFAQYMKDKPIGHIDTAQHAVVDGADFIGINTYPYWTNESIENAAASFTGTLESVKQQAGNRPVWITEVGWPFRGPQRSAAVASAENLQKFWTDVGCQLFGKYTLFWFELVTDSTPDQPDWGLVDLPSRQSRINDLKCSTAIPSGAPVSSSSSSQAAPPPLAPIALPNATALSSLSSQSVASTVYSSSPIQPVAASSSPSSKSKSTKHVNTTVYVTERPTITVPPSNATNHELVTVTRTVMTTVYGTPSVVVPRPSLNSDSTELPADCPWCITVAEIDRNGRLLTIAGAPAGPDGKCSPPQTYSGFPYVATHASSKPTQVLAGTSWCVTMVSGDPVQTAYESHTH